MTAYAGFPFRWRRFAPGLEVEGVERATFANTRSNASGDSSVPISRAASMKRFDCAGSSGGSLGLRGMDAAYTTSAQSSNGSRNWRGSASTGAGRRRFSERRRSGATRETSRSVGQPLALCPEQRAIGAGHVVNAKADPVVVPEIELGCIPMQVLLADVEVAAINAALEDRKEVLDRIGVPERGAHVLLRTMVNRTVAGKITADTPIDRAAVSHQVAGLVDVRDDDRLQALGGHIGNMEAAHAPIAFDQRQHRSLWRDDVLPVGRLAADVGFVGLDDFVSAAERPHVVGKMQVGHRLADTVAEKPCGLQSDAENAMQLVAAHTLLARAKKMHRLQPHMQLNVAGLEDGSDFDGKGLAAGVAFIDADPGALAVEFSDVFLGRAALRTDWTIRPKPRFNERVSGRFAVKLSGGKDGWHGISP